MAGMGWGHVAGCWGMWQGVGSCGRVLGYVAGYGGMWQGWWQGVGARAAVVTCGKGSGLWHRLGHVAGVGTYCRVWQHVAGCGGM